MSLEGSTPLSQNPEGNTAAAISDVNDNSILADTENKSIIQKMVTSANTYGFVYNGKIYLNPELMSITPLQNWSPIIQYISL